jgi:hypothetical protein
MNVKVSLFDHTRVFRALVGFVLAVIGGTFLEARAARWI